MTVTPNAEEEALLRAVFESPHDDALRLAYADWLEENAGTVPCSRCNGRGLVRLGVEKKGGPSSAERCKRYVIEPQQGTFDWGCDGCGGTGAKAGTGYVPDGRRDRAEFIRVQVELARIGNHYDPACPREKGRHYVSREGGWVETVACRECWDALRRREGELFNANADRWFPVPQGYGLNWGIYTAVPEHPLPQYFVVTRGFPSHVTLPLAAFLGKRCGACGGEGYLRNVAYMQPGRDCPSCRGTGYVGGLGAALASAVPLQSVTCPEFEPAVFSDGVVWERAMEDVLPIATYIGQDERSRLPGYVFDGMSGEEGTYYFMLRKHGDKRYEDRKAAMTALSDRLVSIARDWCGLKTGPRAGSMT